MSFLRSDGRACGAIRPVSFQRQFTKFAAGSVLVKFGDTHILCTASVEEGVPPFLQDTGKGWLTAEYRLLPSSTQGRKKRELYKLSGRTAEIQRTIGRSLRAAIDFDRLGPRTIAIDADVLQADGGTRTAAITGGYVALVDACQSLLRQGVLETSPLMRQVAAVSVGWLDGRAIADLCYVEDAAAAVDLNVIMTQTGEYVEIQGTAESEPFSQAQLDEMLALAKPAIQDLCQLQSTALQAD
ncbi:ribonuclease PH [Synechococcus sp. PCC 7336]|uniref:ribonuclease PH n=1 Tax=Synechococcus sp. PCC 7336 TaxID=195250 RepID=UPI000348F51D|nr:ribonuclease PH [Synechococcus sp. PCC 7336]